MLSLPTLLLAFLGLAFWIWLWRAIYLAAVQIRYWPLPPRKAPNPAALVSILVAARNEEKNIGACLSSLIAQDYAPLEIIVADDRSEDRTAEIVESFARKDPRVKRVAVAELPDGWLGKSHALAAAVPHAQGEWFLFTDADTVHEPWSVSSSVAHCQEKGVDLLTLAPRSRCVGFWEKVLQPLVVLCIAVWFPIRKTNDPSSSIVIANGQYILARRRAYETVGGHAAIRREIVEDVALFRKAQKAGFACQLHLGTRLFTTRMYASLRDAWFGWRRVAIYGFQKEVPQILTKIGSLIVFSALPFLILVYSGLAWAFSHDPAMQTVFIASLTVCGFLQLCLMVAYAITRVPVPFALSHPVGAVLVSGILLDAVRTIRNGGATVWKGRAYHF